jgi:hypothetical protein
VCHCGTRLAAGTRDIVGLQPVVIRNGNNGQPLVFVLDETLRPIRPALEAYFKVTFVALNAAVNYLRANVTVFLIGRSVARRRSINNPFEGIEVCSWMATMAGIAEEEVAVETAEVALVVWYTWAFTTSVRLVLWFLQKRGGCDRPFPQWQQIEPACVLSTRTESAIGWASVNLDTIMGGRVRGR